MSDEPKEAPPEDLGKLTYKIKDMVSSTVCEIEYYNAAGEVVGYWAYGAYDPELPYRGEQGKYPA